ncbi:MAG: hypothetical protein PHP01_02445 [Phycisphaerae bacterium]|nr:hypothetical protein [Phycisphaerae bacterium]
MISDLIRHRDFSKKNVVIATLVLIAIVAMYNWFATPYSSYLLAAEKYVNAANEMEKTKKMIDVDLRLKQKKIDELSGKFDLISQDFFTVDEAKSFLESIQAKIEKSGCFVDKLSFSPAKQVSASDGNIPDIEEYRVNLSVIGQYVDIVILLDSLQNRQQKVWVDKLKLKLKDISSGHLVCDVSLSIYTLKVKENANNVSAQK